MPPQQPNSQQPPAPAHDSRYEFILSPDQPKRAGLRLPKGGSKGILFLVGAAAVGLILLILMLNLFRGGGTNAAPFIRVAQEQQEMLRVIAAQETNLESQDAKNFVTNTDVSIASDQQEFNTLLSLNKIKLSKKQLALGQNQNTDTALENAASTSNLDQALVTELRKELTTYQASLRQAFNATDGPKTRAGINAMYENAALLIEQSNQ
jgi:hypothetical protein